MTNGNHQNPEELFDFPVDHIFKAIGVNEPAFVDDVLAAVNTVTAVTRASLKARPSAGGRYQSVSVVVHVTHYPMVVSIYSELKKVDGLKYLL